MSIRQILFSFKGRIPRRAWWIAFLATFPLILLLTLLADMIVFLVTWAAMNGAQISGRISFDSESAGLSSDLPSGAREAWLITQLLVTLIFLWPMLAVCAKRLHDLNVSGWIALIPYLLWGTHLVASYAGLLGPIAPPDTAGLALQTAMSLAGIGLLIVFGFIAGTRGPNPYGPDPLARS